MGSELHSVKVLEKYDRTVTLGVEVVNPGQDELSENLSFALMVLREGTDGHPDAPLAVEVGFRDTLDEDWLQLYTRGFIESVRSMPERSLTVTVTDPAWIEHLRPGVEFAGRAFAAASDFDECEPIHPGRTDPDAPVPEAFISVPGALWTAGGLPAAVRASAYSAGAYHAPDLRTGTLSAADLTDLDGAVVLYQESGDDVPEVGLLALDGDSMAIHFVHPGVHGTTKRSPFTGSIGKAELIAGKRRGSRLRLSRVLRHVEPVLRDVIVDRGAATFSIVVPPGHTGLRALSEERLVGGALQMMLAPLRAGDEFFPRLDPAPLSWTVEREVRRVCGDEHGQLPEFLGHPVHPHDMVERLARGFIASAEVVSRTPDRIGDADALDALSEAGQRELLEQPWPELRLRVTPYHAVYLRHLDEPFDPLPLGGFLAAQPWEGRPATPATAP
ncbi:hypothetical protein [Dactylosporangium sp. NPDC051541]|uniref:hypothetical protein n=1 Tax=Dactylosporangium sp. NPDC051541 TaxID=3363977 RepID=UPI00379B1771